DFDKKIVDWLAEQFLEQEKVDLRRDRQSLQRLTDAAEKAKIELSGLLETNIDLPFVTATAEGPKHIETTLSRRQFEDLSQDLLQRLRYPVEQALMDAHLTPSQIDAVVLVGGATRMPMVQDLVRQMIGREPKQNVNPDEVVAVGAAIQAGILAGDVKDILLLDVTPLSLGVETIGGVTKVLIPRNTTIPVRRSDIFSTSENNQSQVEIHVVQGERELAAHNKSLGRFKLTGIPPAPRGVPQIQVSFDLDANGLLQVVALDRFSGREQSVVIQGASTLSEEEIQQMLLDAESNAAGDRQRRARIEKRNRAQDLMNRAERQLREAAQEFGYQFAAEQRRGIEALVRQLQEAIRNEDDRQIDLTYAALEERLYDFVRQLRLREEEAEDDEEIFKLPNLREAVNKGLDAVRGRERRRDNYEDEWDEPPRTRRSRSYSQRSDSAPWDDWDDDDW
ncbi:Hsp70 family protein, partial [Thermosynechococcus sp. OHK43]|uniref:Hsp70 family protein n=1 Tax=Thermosynechococcus sp. OHK43 TaxID=2763133 RepID=UPI0025FE0936